MRRASRLLASILATGLPLALLACGATPPPAPPPMTSATPEATVPAPAPASSSAEAAAPAAPASSAAPAAEAVKRVTEADNGKTIEARVGDTIVLALPSNPTTGFDWEVTRVDKTFGQPTRKMVSVGPGVGAGGTLELTWTTGKGPLEMAGDHAVELQYHRSFEKGVPPVKTFAFTVRLTK